MATMADPDELAPSLPQTTKQLSEDGRPEYRARIDRDELHDLLAEAWLTRAQKRVAKAWLADHSA